MAKETANVILQAHDRATRTIKKVSRSFGKFGDRVFKVTNTMSSSINIARAAANSLRMLGQAAAIPIKAAIEQERVEKQLQAVLKSTEQAAGLNAEQLIEMAAALQKVTTFGDETIIKMQNVLLTFTQIGGADGIFERTTQVVLDMSEALGTDLKNQAIQIGKVLNDPIARLGDLSRVGVTLTQDQKDLVKSFIKVNDMASAQAVVLEELEREFGGSAKAAVETFGGALKQLSNTWGDLLEVAGQFVTQNAGVDAIVRSATDTITRFTNELDASQGSLAEEIRTAEVFQRVLVGVLGAMQSITIAMAAMADMAQQVVQFISELNGTFVATNEVQKALLPTLEMLLRREKELQTLYQNSPGGPEQHEYQMQLQATQASLKALGKAFRNANDLGGSWGDTIRLAGDQIGALSDDLGGVDVSLAIHQKHLRGAIDHWSELWDTFAGGFSGSTSAPELDLPLVPLIPAPEVVAEQTSVAIDAIAERLADEQDRIVEALAAPISAAVSSAFVDAMANAESLSEGFAEVGDSIKEQMSKALIDPIFGAKSAFNDLIKGFLAPINQVGKAIGDAIFKPMVEGLLSYAVTEKATQTASAASIVGISNAASLAMVPALSAIAGLNLIATSGAAGAAIGELPALLAASKAAGLAAAAVPLATGGMVTGPTFALIGEAGTEAVLPLTNPSRTRDVLEDALAYMGGGTGSRGGGGNIINVTVNATSSDPEELARFLADAVDHALGERVA